MKQFYLRVSYIIPAGNSFTQNIADVLLTSDNPDMESIISAVVASLDPGVDTSGISIKAIEVK